MKPVSYTHLKRHQPSLSLNHVEATVGRHATLGQACLLTRTTQSVGNRCKPILDNLHAPDMVHAVIATASRLAHETAGEEHRRSLLAESDALLDEVEALHLDDHIEAPQPLREAIRTLQIRLGRHDPPLPPATLQMCIRDSSRPGRRSRYLIQT